jgi:hypothetical protein
MFDLFSKWKDKITQNVQLRIDLVKLELIERTSIILSYFIFTIICLLLALCILLFLGMGLGEFFSNLTGSNALGYTITAGIYILLFVILALARRPIVKMFLGFFINVMTDNEDLDDKK